MSESKKLTYVSDATFLCFKINKSRKGYFELDLDDINKIKLEENYFNEDLCVLKIASPNGEFSFFTSKIAFKIKYFVDKTLIYESANDNFYIKKMK